MHTPVAAYSGFIGIFLIQVTFLLVYGIFVRYDFEMLPTDGNATAEQLSSIERQHKVSYPRKFFEINSSRNSICKSHMISKT